MPAKARMMPRRSMSMSSPDGAAAASPEAPRCAAARRSQSAATSSPLRPASSRIGPSASTSSADVAAAAAPGAASSSTPFATSRVYARVSASAPDSAAASAAATASLMATLERRDATERADTGGGGALWIASCATCDDGVNALRGEVGAACHHHRHRGHQPVAHERRAQAVLIVAVERTQVRVGRKAVQHRRHAFLA